MPESNEPRNTETNKVDRNAPITSKDVFPKRSAKMIDGTEKPKIPSKFAKRTARYNEFGSIANLMEEINATFTKKQNLTRRHEES